MNETIGRLSDYDTTRRHAATVVSTERITPPASDEEVRELVLDVDRADLELRVGQSVGVIVPGAAAFGEHEHFRLYSVADLPAQGAAGRPRIKICVRRCSYVDEFSGEQYAGVASNFLCDLAAGDTLTLSGPYGPAFAVPADLDANLILIGTGTGIAPFRAFVKHLYREVPDWRGRLWLFHGAKSGLELLYMNAEKDDFAQYYDRETFAAFRALSARPHCGDPIAWDQAIAERGAELWEMLGQPKTYVYVAGLEPMRDELDAVFARLAAARETWAHRKAELAAGKRWVELLY